MDNDLTVPILATYTQALLTARQKGLKGEAAKQLAIHVTAQILSRKLARPVSEERVVEAIE